MNKIFYLVSFMHMRISSFETPVLFSNSLWSLWQKHKANESKSSFQCNAAFHLNWEVGFSNWNALLKDFWFWKVGWTSPFPTSKSKLAAQRINSSKSSRNILFISNSVFCSIVHTVLSNFYLWTRCYGVCLCQILLNALSSFGKKC